MDIKVINDTKGSVFNMIKGSKKSIDGTANKFLVRSSTTRKVTRSSRSRDNTVNRGSIDSSGNNKMMVRNFDHKTQEQLEQERFEAIFEDKFRSIKPAENDDTKAGHFGIYGKNRDNASGYNCPVDRMVKNIMDMNEEDHKAFVKQQTKKDVKTDQRYNVDSVHKSILNNLVGFLKDDVKQNI